MTKYLLENVQLTNEPDMTEVTLHACTWLTPLRIQNLSLVPAVKVQTHQLWCLGSVVVTCRLSRSAACGILVRQPGIEPASPELQGGFLTTGPLVKPSFLPF